MAVLWWYSISKRNKEMGTRHDPRGPIRPLSSCGPGRANTGARRARYARPGFGRAQDALRSEEKTSGPGTRVLALPKKSVSFYLRVSAYGTRWALAESRIPCPHVGVSARLAAPGLLACRTDGCRGPGCAVSCPPSSSPSLLPPVRPPPTCSWPPSLFLNGKIVYPLIRHLLGPHSAQGTQTSHEHDGCGPSSDVT